MRAKLRKLLILADRRLVCHFKGFKLISNLQNQQKLKLVELFP